MESCILNSPTLLQAMRLKVGDLQKLFVEHTVSDVVSAICRKIQEIAIFMLSQPRKKHDQEG